MNKLIIFVVIVVVLIAGAIMWPKTSNENGNTNPQADQATVQNEAQSPEQADQTQPAESMETSDTEEIMTSVGDEFTVVLASNPTTGFSWKPDFEEGIFELISKGYGAEETDLVGSGGYETFVFKSNVKGSHELKMMYMRPWESKQPTTIKIFNVTVGKK
ncbi:MAG: protease inhibitor I42 family protein [Patescibacteria group bacterium]